MINTAKNYSDKVFDLFMNHFKYDSRAHPVVYTCFLCPADTSGNSHFSYRNSKGVSRDVSDASYATQLSLAHFLPSLSISL